jgi:hypothetical protein
VKVRLEAQEKSAKDSLARLVSLVANAKQTKAEARVELSELTGKIQTNQDLLNMLPEKCANETLAYEASRKDQQEEMAALKDAIEILYEDSSREALSKSVNFLQVSADKQRAADHLLRLGEKFESPHLTLLALKLDAVLRTTSHILWIRLHKRSEERHRMMLQSVIGVLKNSTRISTTRKGQKIRAHKLSPTVKQREMVWLQSKLR